jgi:hypothetical protein
MSATRCPSELEWTRHLAGELSWLAARRLGAHMAGCPRCRAALSAMDAERAAFSADPRRQRDLALLAARAAPAGSGRRGRWWLAGLSGLAAAAAATVLVFALRGPGPDPEWISKGGDLLAVHVQTAGGAVPLGATCAAGDQLMASYVSGHAYLLLLERDGKGGIQVLLPPGGTASARLAAPRGATPQSFVLDEVPGQECFAAFFSDAPVDAARAAAALASGGGAPLLGGAVIRMQCCEKEGAR